GKKVARLCNLAFMADIDPGRAENSLEFQLENFRIRIDPPVHSTGLNEIPYVGTAHGHFASPRELLMPPAVSVCAGKLAMALHARGGGFSQHMAQRTIAQAWFALRYQQSAHIRLRFATSWILRMTTVLITHPAC